MQQRKQQYNTCQGGLSLVEALIAVAFFAILITVSSGAFLDIISSQQDISQEQALLDDLSVTLNTITTEVRNSSTLPGDCESGCSKFRFETRTRKELPERWVAYRLNQTTERIEKAAESASGPCATENNFPSQCFQPLSDENINIESFKVYVENANEDNVQPIVNPIISGSIVTRDQVTEEIDLSTSISPRNNDIAYTNPVTPGNTCPQNVTASHTEDDGSGGDTLTIDFSGSASDPDGDTLTYKWEYGDGTTDLGQNTTYAYSNPERYKATLSVSDGDCTVTDPTIVFAGCGLDLDESSVSESGGVIYWDMWNTCKNKTVEFDASSLSIYATDEGANANSIGWVEGADVYTEFRFAGGYADIKDVDSTCGDHAYCLGNTFSVGTLPSDQFQDGAVSSNSSESFQAGAWYPDTATGSGDYLTFPDAGDEVSFEYQNITNLNSPVEIILAPSGNSTQNTFGQ